MKKQKLQTAHTREMTGTGRVRNAAEYFFYAAAAILLALLAFLAWVNPWKFNPMSDSRTVMVGVLYVVCMTIVVILARHIPEKYCPVLVYGAVACAFLVQLQIAWSMRLEVKIDLSHLYEESVEAIENGTIAFQPGSYFEKYPNNAPLGIVIYWVFRLGKLLGSPDYRLTGGIFNAGMLLCMYLSMYAIMRMFFSEKAALTGMAVLVSNPIFYAYASYYYTDTVSAGMTALAAYLLIRGFRNEKKQDLFSFAGAFLFLLAVQVRVTSSFWLIAALLMLAVRGGSFRRILRVLPSVLAGGVLFLLLWRPLYRAQLPFDTTDTAMPVSHFLMMGSRRASNGKYYKGDDVFTCGFPTHEEKVENTMRVYRERLKENGISGNLDLLLRKEAIVWSSGNKGYRQYTRRAVDETNVVYRLIRGDRSGYFELYLQGYNNTFLMMLCAGCVCALLARRKGQDVYGGLPLLVCIYFGGAFLFYFFWEAHGRQSVSYLPMMTILSLPLAERFYRRGNSI